MIKHKIYILFSILLFLCFTGCDVVTMDLKGMMAPPKANADQQAVYRLLQGSRPELTVIYPMNGDYRAAITMKDFTGDGEDDAIGFSLFDTGSVEVQFLTKRNDQWKTLNRFHNAATQVDRINFADVTGDGIDDVVIGWGNTQNGFPATICVYVYENEMLSELSIDQPYTAAAFTDFNQDGKKEIFFAQRAVAPPDEHTDGTPAKAEVFAYQDGKMDSIYACEADNSIVRYGAALFGRISEDKDAVVLDGNRSDGSSSTQVFTLDDTGQFSVFPVGLNNEGVSNPFSRPTGASFTSRDIDNDGIIEIPTAKLLPALPANTVHDSTSFLVEWVRLEKGNTLKIVSRTLLNSLDNYWFNIPVWLTDKITAIYDSKLRMVTYYTVEYASDGSDPLLGQRLFSIRAFNQVAWAQRGEPSGYEMLAEQGEQIFGIAQHNHDPRYFYSFQIIKTTFSLLSE